MGNICDDGVNFPYNYRWADGRLKMPKTSTAKRCSQEFSKTFKITVFINISWKIHAVIFTSASFQEVILLLQSNDAIDLFLANFLLIENTHWKHFP